ncbi:MAG: Hsp33 family molecular chaperone HslO [Erysipelotrichaceae bacterium]|nr:Hsp33 family molecular chaperone HslO [Erysipelotrichaceae bacterium]
MDYLIRGLALNNKIRILAADSTLSCKEASNLHDCYPLVSVALGRVLTGAAIMGIMLKGEEQLTIQVNGNGTGGTIMADANGKGEVKCFISNPHAESKNGLVKEIVGDLGFLKVIKNIGMKDSFGGEVLLQSGEIGDDLSYYFYTSEQTPSVVGLSVILNDLGNIKKAGGYIIQILPGAGEDVIDKVEEAIKKYSNLNELLKNKKIEDIIKDMFDDFYVMESVNLTYKCNCSKEKFAAGIKLIGKEEIEDMINVDHGCHIKCNFCRKEYVFNEDDLRKLID